jgi:hypothetical protein
MLGVPACRGRRSPLTTGVRPRRPQVRPFGGLSPWPDSSSKQSQAPRSAAVFLSPASPPPSRPRPPPRPARPPGGPGPARSSRSGAAADPARPGCTPPGPAPHDFSDPGQRPALARPAPGGRARVQHRLQLAQLGRAELAPGTTGALRGQRRPATSGQCPPPPVRRHPAHPEPPAHIPVTGPASIKSAAANRTCSRRARSAAVRPPPSGYLMPQA